MPHSFIHRLNSAHGLVRALVVLASLIAWQPAAAQLKVSESVIEMQANEQETTIQMSNSGSEPLTVSLDLTRVLNAGTFEPTDEVTQPVAPSVMSIAPNNFKIAPNQTVSVHVRRALHHLDTDEIFRVRVTPSFAQPQSGMNIRLSYDLLLMVRPQNSQPDIQLTQTNNDIALINHGNSNALLSSMAVCDELLGVCESLRNIRLYTHQVLPLAIPTTFNLNHTVVKTTQTHRAQNRRVNYRLPTVSVSR